MEGGDVRGHFAKRGARGTAPRIPWMLCAPFEFAAIVLMGGLLYAGGALYFAACIWLKTVSGLFGRAVALAAHRFRVGPGSREERNTPTPHLFAEESALGPVGRGRFHSW